MGININYFFFFLARVSPHYIGVRLILAQDIDAVLGYVLFPEVELGHCSCDSTHRMPPTRNYSIAKKLDYIKSYYNLKVGKN